MIESSWNWVEKIDKHYIDKLILDIESKYPVETAVMGQTSAIVDEAYRSSKVAFVKEKDFPEIWGIANSIINNANKYAYNFDINSIADCQYTVYDSDKKGKYDWHMDTFIPGNTTFDRKITLIIQLSDPEEYEGGLLEFQDCNYFDRGYVQKLRLKGTAITFPSFIRHKVGTVTKGVRRSLIFWMEGPAFR
jgi:PKHD-type hydroxylase